MHKSEREQEFYINVIIKDKDRKRAEKALLYKGVEKHILIKEMLLSKSDNRYIEYEKIASTYRYDKRIRYTLFKYISYLEELYRAIILDNYSSNLKQNFWTPKFQETLKKLDYNLNNTLEEIGFSTLFNQVKRLPEEVRAKYGFTNIQHLEQNFNALRELRNAVMHNKFLLLYSGENFCDIQGVDKENSTSLKAHILNLIQFLPPAVGKQCIKDINARKKADESENKENDLKWDLPSQVVITIDELN